MDNHNSYQWKNIYVFISSTFNDMHAERDYLVKNVFPELSVWCNERMLRLVDIDLRWGITEEDSKINKRVVDICLNRIDDCRPFFLCFLGQRRGWIPKKEDVSEETLKRQGINEVIGKESVTEMEIRHAVLQPFWDHKTEELGVPVDNAFFFFRDSKYLESIKDRPELMKIFTNMDEENEKEADEAIVKSKKEIIEICKKHDHSEPILYDATWDNTLSTPELCLTGVNESINKKRTKGRLRDFKALGDKLKDIIIELLKEAILKEYPERARFDWELHEGLEHELLQQSEFINTNFEGFIKRKGDFEKLNYYVDRNDNNILAVTADAGLGKTTLIANWILELLEKDDCNICYRFVGASNRTDTINHILESIVEELKYKNLIDLDNKLYLESEDILVNGEKIKRYFYDILSTLNKKTIFVIDGLNQLTDELESSSYLWLPRKLPVNAKFIVSFKCSLKEELKFAQFLELERKAEILNIEPFNDISERKKLVDEYLSKNLKSLDEAKLDSLLSIEATKNPLFLKIVLSELRVYGSFETLLNKIKYDFGSSPKDAFISVLKRLEEDTAYCRLNSEVAVSSIFGLISTSRNGLEINELTEALIKITKNQLPSNEIEDSIHLYLRQLRPFLARRENRVDFLYEAFDLAAKEKYCDRKEFYHEILSSVFRDKVDIYNNKRWEGTEKRAFQELPYHLSFVNSQREYNELLFDYKWLYRKLQLFDVRDVINDFSYALSNELKLLCRCLEQASNILESNYEQLPVQLWGRLCEINNPRIKDLLQQAANETKKIWLKPERAVFGDVRSGIIGSYEGNVRHLHKLYSYKNRIVVVGYFWVDIWDTALNKLIYSMNIKHYGRAKQIINLNTIESLLINNRLTVKTEHNIYVWNVDNGENLTDFGLSEEECQEYNLNNEVEDDEYKEYKIESFYIYNNTIVVVYRDYFSILDIEISKFKQVLSPKYIVNKYSLVDSYFILDNNSEVIVWDLNNIKDVITVNAADNEEIISCDLYNNNLYVIKAVKEKINKKKLIKKVFLEIWDISQNKKNIFDIDEKLPVDYNLTFNIHALSNNIIITNGDIHIIDSAKLKVKCSLHGKDYYVHENKIYYYDYQDRIIEYDLERNEVRGSFNYIAKEDDIFYCIKDCLFTYHDFMDEKPWMNIWNIKSKKCLGTVFGGHCQTFVKDDKIIVINETELYIIKSENGLLLNIYEIFNINSLIISEDRIYCGQGYGSILIVELHNQKETPREDNTNLNLMNKFHNSIYGVDNNCIRIFDKDLKMEKKCFQYKGFIERLNLSYPYMFALVNHRKFETHNEYVSYWQIDQDYFIKKLENESLFTAYAWNVQNNQSFQVSRKLLHSPDIFNYENYMVIKSKSSVEIFNIDESKCIYRYEYINMDAFIKCCKEKVYIGDGERVYIYDMIQKQIIMTLDLFKIYRDENKESGKFETFAEYNESQKNIFALAFEETDEETVEKEDFEYDLYSEISFDDLWTSDFNIQPKEHFYLNDFIQDDIFKYNNYLIIKLNGHIKVLDIGDFSIVFEQKLSPSISYEANKIYLMDRYLVTFSCGDVYIWNLDTLILVDNFSMLFGEYETWKVHEFKEFLLLQVNMETRIWSKNTEQSVHIFTGCELIKFDDERLFFQDFENYSIHLFDLKSGKSESLSTLSFMDKLEDVQKINDSFLLLEYKKYKVIYNTLTGKVESVNMLPYNNYFIWEEKARSIKVDDYLYGSGNANQKYKIEFND